MTGATLLVLLIIVVELYRPIIIGNAIDRHINGYYSPYTETDADAAGAVPYRGTYLTREFTASADGSDRYYQILLYDSQYYMAERITAAESAALTEADSTLTEQLVNDGAPLLTKEQLKELRHFDFTGILAAAALYLFMLLLGFVLNAADACREARHARLQRYRGSQ